MFPLGLFGDKRMWKQKKQETWRDTTQSACRTHSRAMMHMTRTHNMQACIFAHPDKSTRSPLNKRLNMNSFKPERLSASANLVLQKYIRDFATEENAESTHCCCFPLHVKCQRSCTEDHCCHKDVRITSGLMVCLSSFLPFTCNWSYISERLSSALPLMHMESVKQMCMVSCFQLSSLAYVQILL